MKRPSTKALGAMGLATAALVAATPAVARPGTPDHEVSWSPYPGQMAIRWQNTANENGIVFDIEGQSDPSVANWAPPGGARIGAIVTYTFYNLRAGRHCFRIWSRVGAQGLRSDDPSAFTCANVVAAEANPANNPHPRH